MTKVGINHEGIIAETDAAVLFNCQDREVWVPKSQIEDYNNEAMIIPQWLADERDLEPDYDL